MISSSSLLIQCDELDIVYYSKDTFVYKTTDTSGINFFKELITSENEKLRDTCKPTGKLVFKNKGIEILDANLAIGDSVGCQYVTYSIKNKMHGHRLTYRQGMALDGIYWRKVDPKSNPSTGLDTSKYRYEEYKTVTKRVLSK